VYLPRPSFYKESEMAALVRKKKKILGAGEYGTVKMVRVAGQKFAVKTSKIDPFPKHLENVMAALREEQMTCQHPHIIERIWCRFYDSKFSVCMELGKPVKHASGKQVLQEIGQALRFMHSHGFIHRDVKPQNIVRVGQTLKLIDFGLTRKGDATGAPITGYMCSRYYRPPELLRASENYDLVVYDGRVDMWSLALTAYELQNDKLLFYGDVEMILSQYAKYKQVATGLFSHLLCDYEHRWTAQQMLESHKIALIPGTICEVEPREGVVGEYVKLLLEGNEDSVADIGYKGINELL
jgi:serine/threonine protein kinase